MSVSMSRSEGVTVFTLTSDPHSRWPPLCQIFKSLCYSPVCCSVSQHLRKVQRTSLSVLGTLHIMVGLLNIGLGVILQSSPLPWYQFYTGFPYWLGALFILFGITSILSERFPSPCLVIINVILNLCGVAFAITAIVLYSINLGNVYLWYDCDRSYYWRETTPSPSAEEDYLKERCLQSKDMIIMLLRCIYVVLIVLGVLEFCVTVSCAVLGIKALKSQGKDNHQTSDPPELYKPLLEEVTTKPAA